MINIIGQMFGTSGYCNHTRGLANALNKITECKLVTNLVPNFERQVNDAELEMIKKEGDFDINLIITHPVNWRSNMGAKRNWVYLIWEGDTVPKWMAEECKNKNIEKIIVPSNHTLLALTNGLKDDPQMKEVLYKTKLIPHGVDLEIYSQVKKDDSEVPNRDHLETRSIAEEDNKEERKSVEADNQPGPFIFFANKGLRNMEDRGGVQYLIKAYLEEFPKDNSNKLIDNTMLIIKLNPAYGIPNIIEIFPELKGRDDVVFHTADYTLKQMNELYNDCDVFVSTTRAEAFNLPCLEAMACGKPVITTNYGGQTDFCSDETGWLIDYDLTEVTHEIEYEGVKWATPKHDDIRPKLRLAYESSDLTRKSDRSKQVSKNYTWENTAKLVSQLSDKSK